MKSKTYNGEVRSSEKDFETLQLGAFATPGLLLAQGPVGLTAKSGFIHRCQRSGDAPKILAGRFQDLAIDCKLAVAVGVIGEKWNKRNTRFLHRKPAGQ
jgi:hypothetical protein